MVVVGVSIATSVVPFDIWPRWTSLGANFLDFVRIFSVQQVDLLLEMVFDVAAHLHGFVRIDQIDGDTIFTWFKA